MAKTKYMKPRMWRFTRYLHCSETATCDLNKIGELSKIVRGLIKNDPNAYMIPEDF